MGCSFRVHPQGIAGIKVRMGVRSESGWGWWVGMGSESRLGIRPRVRIRIRVRGNSRDTQENWETVKWHQSSPSIPSLVENKGSHVWGPVKAGCRAKHSEQGHGGRADWSPGFFHWWVSRDSVILFLTERETTLQMEILLINAFFQKKGNVY